MLRGPLVNDDALMHEVHPGLFLGGSWEPYPDDVEFDVVVTVCTRWEAFAPPECRSHLEIELRDNETTDQDEAIALAVRMVGDAVDRDLRTLVRCYAGQNRSALVVAHVLAARTGQSGADVIRHLRSIRGPHLFWNARFEAAILAIEPWETICARECGEITAPTHIPNCRRHAPRHTLET